eukprot:TRINITY_DN717_c0_g1_i3.p1 TRINITY_DN717_c0_g1~~TRINITY_DN717_c0_g1_i3.p1  ORF type:complete len:354 (+),score=85.52 TRINITY_DN717_c0_g1_i3:61-1062(+)
MIPAITITKQHSLFEEIVVKNGCKKNVNYIVKNTPFTIDYSLVNMPVGVNFKNARVCCSLLYDLKSKKEVDFITKKPLEYVVHPSDDGETCTIEFRVKVLTTQLEGSFFLINTVFEKGDLKVSVESQSIKAVSKPAQIRRKIAQRDGVSDESGIKRRTKSGKKRPRPDDVSEHLVDIQNVQDEHTQMLQTLINMFGKRQQQQSYYYPGYYSPEALNMAYATAPVEARPATQYVKQESVVATPVKSEPMNPEEEFEKKLKELVELYAKLNPDDRKQKFKKVMDSMEGSHPEPVSEIRTFMSPPPTTGNEEIFSPNLPMDELNDFCLAYLQGTHV